MKYLSIAALCSTIFLTACGNKTDAPTSSTKETVVSAKADNNHYFNHPYVCERSQEVTSERTGKARTRIYKSYYHPQKEWRIDDRSSSVSLYTQDTRYDGVGKSNSGSKAIARMVGLKDEDLKQAQFIFASAFPYTNPMPQVSTENLSNYKKKNCKVLSDTSVFEINYLERLEVIK